MRFDFIKLVILPTLLISFFGCTHSYSVKPFPIKPELVPEMNVKDPICVVNTQTDGKNSVFFSGMGSKWIGDLSEWTEQAAGLLEFELKKRNITIAEDAPKMLKLAVTEGKLSHEFAGVRCVVMLKVEAGNGYICKYEGNHRNSSPFAEQARHHAGAGAITKAVTAILNDRSIIDYLEN